MTASLLRCPNPVCSEPVRPEDSFCEACGQPVPVDSADAAGLGAARRAADDGDRRTLAFPDLAAVSDRGLKRRRNEDAMAIARLQEARARVLVVCDGVSTSSDPASASRAAADAALAYLVAAIQDHSEDAESAMREAVAAAQRAVCALTYPRGHDEPPATTLVAGMIKDRTATVGWVGDSRAYYVSASASWKLSRDDTWATEQVELGHIDEEEALTDPRAHALTNWLGEQDGELQPSICTFVIPDSGCLLLCSDGLWNYAPSPERMRELVMQFPEDAAAVDLASGLTDFARSLGGADNITVAVAFV